MKFQDSEKETIKTNRREFLKRTIAISGASVFGLGVLSHLDLNAEIINADDPRLVCENIQYAGGSGQVNAYLARPKAKGKYPGLVVIHENRGLQPHIKDVTRRFALEGFVALAPDALSPQGGIPDKIDEVPALIQKLDYELAKKDYVAAVEYLKTNPQTNGKVGCTGFSWGGAMTAQVAINTTNLDAAVPYYGSQPKSEDVPKIKAPMLIHYAGNDERINKGIPDFEAALKQSKIDYQIFIYEGAAHSFNNDSNPERYNKAAADLAWSRTVSFFKEKLK